MPPRPGPSFASSRPPPSRRPVPPALLRLADERAWAAGAVVIAAHPDDETIGIGGVLRHLSISAIVYATDGAPRDRRWWGDPAQPSREAYAAARRAELTAALALSGIDAGRIRCLDREDQRGSFGLAGLADDVARVVAAHRPGVILTHAYEGGHPDHDATAFAVHAARMLVELSGDGDPPVILEFAGYFAHGEGLATGRFVERDGCESVDVPLSDADRERKRRMMACFRTQRETLAQFSVGEVERFRIAPEYDFTRPPHEGMLNYERFDWGTTGAEFRARAAEALDVLGIAGAVPC